MWDGAHIAMYLVLAFVFYPHWLPAARAERKRSKAKTDAKIEGVE